jgi:hypothetical protein
MRAAMTQKKRSSASSSCARPGRIGRVVAKRRILDEMPHHVDPSTPRRNQKRSASRIAAFTFGFRQFRSGCSAR